MCLDIASRPAGRFQPEWGMSGLRLVEVYLEVLVTDVYGFVFWMFLDVLDEKLAGVQLLHCCLVSE